MRRSAGFIGAGILAAVLLLAGRAADAQTAQPPPARAPAAPPAPKLVQRTPNPHQARRLKLNRDTLIVVAGQPGTSHLAMANDLAAAVERSLRILPIAAGGGPASLEELLYLRGVDMAIVAANVLAHAKAESTYGSGLGKRIAYIAPLYAEEIHAVAGRDIATLADLGGKKVAVPRDDGAAQFTAEDLWRRLGIAVESVPMGAAEAVGAVQAGKVAAALLVAGKPAPLLAALPKDGSVRLIAVPHAPALGEGYSPAVLLAEDYPALIPPGAIVETVAVRAVLVTHGDKSGDRSVRRIAEHVPALLHAASRLAGRHPKWREVNLGAVLPGWKRSAASEAWLGEALDRQRQLLQERFDAFLRARKQPASAKLSDAQRRKLFEEFQRWARRSITNEPAAR